MDTNNDVHWFWKWSMFDFIQENRYEKKSNNQNLIASLVSEYNKLFTSHFENVKGKIINHPHNVDIDKLSQLKIAQQCGLQIPATIITSQKENLCSFYKQYKKIITKNLTASLVLELNNKYYQTFTSLISEEFIKKQPPCFFPSLFQEAIEKEFELRIIYVGGQFFSCAIINAKYEIDSRMQINNNTAQIVPYKLPNNIENKLHDFMQKANLQIGSIDMIYSINQQYVFLEVNPSGQILGYSERCNYHIDKIIAKYLIECCHEKN
jgi:glutathione synthase/RimK-type ligase-like ATP-grasp enzyme